MKPLVLPAILILLALSAAMVDSASSVAKPAHLSRSGLHTQLRYADTAFSL